jgi:hypothetical protein
MNDPYVDIRLLELRESKPDSVLHRWEVVRYNGSPVDVELSTDVTYERTTHTVTLHLGVHYTTLRSQIRRRLLDYAIEARFQLISDGALEIDDDEVVISTELLRLMLSIGIGALRGMISLRTAGTFLVHYPLPIYNMDRLIHNIVMAGDPIESDIA